MPWGRGFGWRGWGWGARLGYCPWTGLPRGWRWFYPYYYYQYPAPYYWGQYYQGSWFPYQAPQPATTYPSRAEIEEIKRKINELMERVERLGGRQ